jgi:hypothetical protein
MSKKKNNYSNNRIINIIIENLIIYNTSNNNITINTNLLQKIKKMETIVLTTKTMD